MTDKRMHPDVAGWFALAVIVFSISTCTAVETVSANNLQAAKLDCQEPDQ